MTITITGFKTEQWPSTYSIELTDGRIEPTGNIAAYVTLPLSVCNADAVSSMVFVQINDTLMGLSWGVSE